MNSKNTKAKSELYRDEILNNIAVGLYRVTEDGLLVSASNGLAEMFGFTGPEELINQSISCIYMNPDQRAKLKKTLAEKGEVDNYTTRLKRKDGSSFRANITARAILHNGKLKYYDGIIRDIDHQMKTEENLARSEEKFRSFFRNIRDAIIVTDRHGIITDCNPAFTELFGYSAEEMLGKNTSYLYGGEENYRSVGDNISEKLNNEGPFIYTIEYKKKSGDLFTGETGLFYLKNEKNENTGYIASIRDDTQRSLAEKSLLKAKQKAEEADRLKTAFIANMSHEIRTPMNAVLGFAEFLTDPGLSRSDLKDFVKIIQENGSALINLIDDIMDVSRIESGDLKLEFQEYEMNEVLRNIYNTIIPHFKPRSSSAVDTRLILPEKNAEIILKTDVQRLRQILYNLISNAFKYTEQGIIEVGYELLPDAKFRIYVKDSGIGVEPEKQELIFERFRRADESTTRKYSGTGIGLTIAKKLMEMLHGKIWVESAAGRGSVFYCEFPSVKLQKENEAMQKTGSAFGKGINDLSGKTILVAEDYESNYYFLEAVLKNAHAEVIWCKNGQETLDALGNGHQVDMVLMDVQMPVMSGNEALKLIRRSGNNIPVIAQTAYATSKEMQECMKAGYNDYITKPIRVKKLLDTIMKYI
mgnify:CR=1 FL=1